ncbi:MAG: hypothetical protein KDB67_03890, partial [Gordonia sp.]|nr:hypothetical protein [Gordonia sp. (in: high G+C Gram-positive bacteria)]
AAKAKGFGMAAGKKRPGARPVAKPAVAEPAGEVEEIADAEPVVEAAAPAATETIAPAVTEAGAAKAKGFGMAAGKKRPGHH